MIIERNDYKVNWLSDIEKVPKLKRGAYHRTEPWLCNVCEKVWQGETRRMIEYLADFRLADRTIEVTIGVGICLDRGTVVSDLLGQCAEFLDFGDLPVQLSLPVSLDGQPVLVGCHGRQAVGNEVVAGKSRLDTHDVTRLSQ